MMPGPVGIESDGGQVVMVNAHAEQLFGVAPDELLARQVGELLPGALRWTHATNGLRCPAEPRTRPMGTGMPLAARRTDGTEVPVEISASSLGGSSAVLHCVCRLRAGAQGSPVDRRPRDLLDVLHADAGSGPHVVDSRSVS